MASTDSIIDLSRRVNFKLYKLAPESQACIVLENETLKLIAGREVAIGLDSSLGVIIKGKTSIVAMPNEVKIAGMWKFNNQLLSTIPSTIMSPVSVLDFNMPGQDMFKFLKGFMKEAAAWFLV